MNSHMTHTLRGRTRRPLPEGYLSEKKDKLQRLEPDLATLHDASVVAADRAQAA